MEWIIIVLVVAVALVCPAMMLGPMLIRRLGVGRADSAMSCMPTSSGDRSSIDGLEVLRRRRAELDDEIAVTKILADGAARRDGP